MDAKRDWGHAKDYVEMQWLMLQQDKAEDFVIATGVQYTVREFIEFTAKELGIQIEWQGEGVSEVGVVSALLDSAKVKAAEFAIKVGDVIVKIDEAYFRPAEVETLLGDPSKAKQKLGWVPQTTLHEMIEEMVSYDLDQARQHALLERSGFTVSTSRE